ARLRPARIAPTFEADPGVVRDGSPSSPQHDEGPLSWRSGTYPERVLDELRAHNAVDWSQVAVLPTSQSYDRGEIAVIEDDGTILLPEGTYVKLDPASLGRRFLELHDDEYDYINVFMASNITNLTLGPGAFAYELNVRNEVQGLGLSIYDFSNDFGSNGVLKSFLNMNKLSSYPANPNTTFLGTNSFLDVLGQEAGHRFSAFIGFDDAGTVSNGLLGRSDAHWSFFHNSLASDLEGNRIRDNQDGTFTTVEATNGFSFLDEYLFGLRDSSQVDTLWYVTSPSNFSPAGTYTKGSGPQVGVTFSGTRRAVSVQQIVAANGLRVPTTATSQKTFKMAWVLVTRNGEAPTSADLAKIESFRNAWGPYFSTHTEGLGAFDNTVNSVAGSVAIEHVALKDTENLGPRPVTAEMFIRQRSLLIGFDPSSPRLHWRASGGGWSVVVLSSGGGNTWTGAIPAQSSGTIVDYYLSAASDSAGIDARLPASAPAQFFTYRAGTDVTAPVLAHVPPPDPAYTQLPLDVQVTASDNLDLDSVSVAWRVNSNPEQVIVVAATGDGPYAFSIGSGAGFGDVITYRFGAVDKAAGKNRSLLPSGTAPYALLVGSNVAESFEAGGGGYSHSNLVANYIDQWHRSNMRNATPGGEWSWKCGATTAGPYGATIHAALVSGPLPVGPNGTLRFKHWFDMEAAEVPGRAYDGGQVQLSLDGGSSWQVITPLGGYPYIIMDNPDSRFPGLAPVYSGQSGDFVTATFNLAAYAGQTVKVRWLFGTDAFVGGEGWYIDDVTLQSDGGEPTAVPVQPVAFALGAPSPNPMKNGRTTLSFALPQAASVHLALYDARGRLVRTLMSGPRPAGAGYSDWDGRDESGRVAAAGLYFARFEAQGLGVKTSRLVVVR
ncbi:MAG: FlgD immunoglobulin-like domain containing protein, partial [Candidatus Eisenbacteria bacterium]